MKWQRWDLKDWCQLGTTENEGSTLSWRIEKMILCMREQNFDWHIMDTKVITLCYGEQEGGWSFYHNIIIITDSWIIGCTTKFSERWEAAWIAEHSHQWKCWRVQHLWDSVSWTCTGSGWIEAGAEVLMSSTLFLFSRQIQRHYSVSLSFFEITYLC